MTTDYNKETLTQLVVLAATQNGTVTTLTNTVEKLCDHMREQMRLQELCIRLLYLRTPSQFPGEDVTDSAANVSVGGTTDE